MCHTISSNGFYKTGGVIAVNARVRITWQSCAGLVGICVANMCSDYLSTGPAPATRRSVRNPTGQHTRPAASRPYDRSAHRCRASKQRPSCPPIVRVGGSTRVTPRSFLVFDGGTQCYRRRAAVRRGRSGRWLVADRVAATGSQMNRARCHIGLSAANRGACTGS